MSRVVTGLRAPSQAAESSTRPLTLNERFASITPVKSNFRSTYPSSSSSSSTSHPSSADTAAGSSLSSRFASASGSNGSTRTHSSHSSSPSSAPAPSNASPAAPTNRPRQVRLKGGRTVNVGPPASTAARASDRQQQQKTARLTVVQKRRLTVKPVQRQTPADPQSTSAMQVEAVAAPASVGIGGDLGRLVAFNPFMPPVGFMGAFNPGMVAVQPVVVGEGRRQGVKARGRGRGALPGQIAVAGGGGAGKKKTKRKNKPRKGPKPGNGAAAAQ